MTTPTQPTSRQSFPSRTKSALDWGAQGPSPGQRATMVPPDRVLIQAEMVKGFLPKSGQTATG